MQQTQQEGSSGHAEDDHTGSEKRQERLSHAHHSPCGAARGQRRKACRSLGAH